MSRLDYITIAIVVICLFALGFLVYKTIGLMNSDTPVADTSVEDSYDLRPDTLSMDNEGAVISDGTQDLDDDELGDTEEGVYAGDQTSQPGSSSSLETADEPTEDLAETTNKSQPERYSSSTTGSSAGKYMVLAGSFKVRSNADSRVKELRKLGYTDAEVALFNNGAFAAAMVNRYDSYSEAKALVDELKKTHGLEAFIKRK